jgi:NAD+ kinase
MPSSRRRRVALIIKRSAYDLAMEEPDDRLHALLEQGDPTVANVLSSHEAHTATVAEVKAALVEEGVEVVRVKKRREPFDATQFDLVVVVGGDGTMLRASHNVSSETPVLAVNSAPEHSVGFFCGAERGNVTVALAAALRGKLPRVLLTRMRVTVNDQIVHSRVLNDALYCHQSPAATTRYIIELGDVCEEQKSSGMWIGPAAGSTAAQRSAGGKVLPLSSKALQLVVREPYTPDGRPYALSRQLVKPGEKLVVRSKSRRMRMYLDGHETVVRLDLGDVVTFEQSPEALTLLGISSRRKWGERAG